MMHRLLERLAPCGGEAALGVLFAISIVSVAALAERLWQLALPFRKPSALAGPAPTSADLQDLVRLQNRVVLLNALVGIALLVGLAGTLSDLMALGVSGQLADLLAQGTTSAMWIALLTATLAPAVAASFIAPTTRLAACMLNAHLRRQQCESGMFAGLAAAPPGAQPPVVGKTHERPAQAA
jgi:hypothetical protein